MFSGPGEPRPSYAGLISALQPMDPGELRFRADQLARVFTDRGVTFDLGGEERPFPLDLVPRVIDAVEWDLIVRGVRQRVYALEAFLADVYGDRQVFKDGVVPWRVLLTSSGFHREVAGLVPPNGVRVQVAGIDLIRDEHGQLRVLEDNVRIPSGVSYVIENRLAMTRTFPGLFAEQRVQSGGRVPGPAAGRAARRRPGGRARPGGGRAHPRRQQRGLLRARAAGPADGGRAGRGARPVLHRQPGLRADHARPAAGRRDLPARRRRLPRSGPVPAGLGDRLRRADQRGPGRATSRSPTGSATAWPTTSSSTPTCPT